MKTLRSLWWVPAVVIPVLWFIDWRESLVKRGWALHAACIADQQKSFMDLRPDVDRFFDSYNSRDLPLDRAEVVWRATIEACSTREAFERWRMQSESWDVYSEDEYLDRSLTTTADVGGRFSGRFKGEWIRGDWDTKSAMSACQEVALSQDFQAECRDGIAWNTESNYGEAWLVKTNSKMTKSGEEIIKIWVLKRR